MIMIVLTFDSFVISGHAHDFFATLFVVNLCVGLGDACKPIVEHKADFIPEQPWVVCCLVLDDEVDVTEWLCYFVLWFYVEC